MRSCSATLATRRRTSSSARPSCSGPKASSSKAVLQKSWTSASWKTKPTRLRNSRRNAGSSSASSVSAWPNAVIVPAVGNTRPSSILSSVDLPEPFAPAMATCWPASIVRSMPASAATARAVLVPDAGEHVLGRRGHRGITTLSSAEKNGARERRDAASHSPVARGGSQPDERGHRAGEAAGEHGVVDVVGGLHRLARDERHALGDPAAVLLRRAGRQHPALAGEVRVLHGAQQRHDLLLRHRERRDDEVGNAQRRQCVQQVGPARRPHDEQADARAGGDARDEPRGDVDAGLSDRERARARPAPRPGVIHAVAAGSEAAARRSPADAHTLRENDTTLSVRGGRERGGQRDEPEQHPERVDEARGHREQQDRQRASRAGRAAA